MRMRSGSMRTFLTSRRSTRCGPPTTGCVAADIPELTTLVGTLESWWSAIGVVLSNGLTNAAAEGTNRLIKQVEPTACGSQTGQLPPPGTVALHPTITLAS